MDACARNGLLDHIDFLSLHPYLPSDRFEQYLAEVRAWLRDHNREGMPLWVRETIAGWPAGKVRPATDGNIREHVLEMAVKAVEARACGVARYFPFLYTPFEEDNKNYGMLDNQYAPLPFVAAYFTLARLLAGSRYNGDLVHSDARIKSARVFRSADHCIVVLYTGTVDSSERLRFSQLGDVDLIGIDGRSLQRCEDGTLPVPDGLTYMLVSAESLSSLLNQDTSAARLFAVGNWPPPDRQDPSPIVLQHLIAPGGVRRTASGYWLEPKGEHRFPLSLRINNVSCERHTAALRLCCASDHTGSDLAGVSSEVVPEQGYTIVDFEIDPAACPSDGGVVHIEAFAQTASGLHASPLAIDIVLGK